MESLFYGTSEIFRVLVNYTRDISIFICIIFTIRFICAKRLPAWWSYSLWLLLLVRMAIPLELKSILDISNTMPVFIDKNIPGSEILNKDILISGTITGGSSYWQVEGVSLDNMALFLWALGFIAFGTYIVIQNFRFWVMIKGIPVLTDKRVLGLLEECKARMNIRKTVDIIITDKVRSPGLFGYFCPRLLLPEGILEKFSHKELAYIFMHEAGHLKGHDIAVSWFITLFHMIQWFNPLVWLAFYQMRVDQETACDESVLSRSRQRKSLEYANVIIGFLERFGQNKQLASMAYILENKSQIKRRLAMIVRYRKYSKRVTVMATTLLIIIGLGFFVFKGFAKQETHQLGLGLEIKDVIDGAAKAIQNRDFKGAERIIRTYMSDESEQIPNVLYIMLGDVYSGQGKPADALKILEKGHEAYPEDFEINQRIMNCYAEQLFENGDFIEAGKCYEGLYEIYTDKRFMLSMAANSYFMAGELDEAKRVYRRMVDLLGDMDVVWLETLIRTGTVLGLEDETDAYRNQLRETGVHSDLLTSEITETVQTEVLDWNNGEKVYQLSEVNDLPRIVKHIKPRYPVKAEQGKISGNVILRFIVTKEGRVSNAQIIQSDPAGVFDESALDAVRDYRFEPATRNGRAVDVLITAPILYNVLGDHEKTGPVKEASAKF